MEAKDIKKKKVQEAHFVAMLDIMITSNLLELKTAQILKPFDLSTQQFNVLRILRGAHPNPLNLSDIQERMMDKMSNATRLVEKLRQKHLLTRDLCESNRRKVDIEITQQGLDLLTTLDPLLLENLEVFKQQISKEEAITLSQILAKARQ
ncbi:MarR family winged helix-turn-helix transcriptional regulator [Chitinophaga defluvii]|uniref:MarR family transcriptional regulator n=1 Tax=Chitinophaga defluvii TaxID=3163343 RepID=A0ABV2T3Y9_9BACT